MIAYNKLRGLAILAAVLIMLPVPGADARTRKGDKLLKLAQAAEARKDYDAALDFYTQALSQDPQDTSYQLGARRIRFQASQVHVEVGVKLRQAVIPDSRLRGETRVPTPALRSRTPSKTNLLMPERTVPRLTPSWAARATSSGSSAPFW